MTIEQFYSDPSNVLKRNNREKRISLYHDYILNRIKYIKKLEKHYAQNKLGSIWRNYE